MSSHKLPRSAYELQPGAPFEPYTYGRTLPEFTVKAVLSGIVLGMIFGAANTYLGLKAGLTISTSIPVAVLSVVTFRALSFWGAPYSILETNMSQTVGSASSSVASGALFTLPALFMWNMAPEWQQMTLLSMAGGLLGVLAMIPLRRYLIQEEHGRLLYPEGMACSEVLVAAESNSPQAAGVFWGIGVGMFFKLLTGGFKLVPDEFSAALPFPRKAVLSVGVSPALIGVGYILGVRIATVMVAGGALSALVLIPAIHYWGQGRPAPLYPETQQLIRDMSAHDLWNRYIRYIGAGAVATGGLVTLIRSIPTMIQSFRLSIRNLGHRTAAQVDRTQQDLGMHFILLVTSAVLLTLIVVPGILGHLDSYLARSLAAILVAVFAFFFVTVSSRIVGLVGQTSNPTSGMTIASLLGTSMIFFLMGWTDDFGKATALMVGTVVCVAASIAGDTSQDLKTGFILGATPRKQQLGELIGVITSAGVVCWVLILLNESFHFGSEELPAPQATLMKLVVEGVLDRNLPWPLILIGVGIAGAAALLHVPVLPFAVGVYLPLDTMAAVFVGGWLRWLLTARCDPDVAERRRERGVLFGSGLVGGGGLTGVLLALAVVANRGQRIEGYAAVLADLSPLTVGLIALSAIVLLVLIMRVWIVQADRGFP